MRLYEIGIVIRDYCLYFGFTGIISRSIKIIYDGRFNGYEFYEELNYTIYYSSIGDCLDRYILRYNEMIESCKIIYSIYYTILSSYYSSLVNSFSLVILWSIISQLLLFLQLVKYPH